MGVASSARLLAAGSAWRVTGLDAAGRSLISAASHGDENDQTIAGIFLVKAGDRSVRLVGKALQVDPSLTLVDVLASIGTNDARAVLEGAANGQPSEIADAARQALQTLDEIDRRRQ